MKEHKLAFAATAAALLLWSSVMCFATGCTAVPETAQHTAVEAAAVETAAANLAQLTVRTPGSPRYTRFSPYSGSGPLQPRDDYGLLLPYVGAQIPTEHYILDKLPLWGLVTREGQLVTDPVYSAIEPYGTYLLLYRGLSPEEARYQALNEDRPANPDEAPYTVTVAGLDGSWTMDADDWNHSILLDDGRLAVALKDGAVMVLTPDGEIQWKFPRSSLMPYLGVDYAWVDASHNFEDGGELVYAGGPLAVCFYDEDAVYGTGWRYDCFLDIDNGTVAGTPPENWNPDAGWGDWEETPEFDGYDYPERLTDLVTGETFYCAGRAASSAVTEDLLDSAGNALLPDCFTESSLLWDPIVADGLVGVIQDGAFQYLRIDTGRVVFSYPIDSVDG